ncbi:MAG TPA: hypothetical protein VHN80_21100 [Kineosporiaceae bacterium]|jgi:hypothetical protein|nr:hypothetical protein [Kineosporiaceae bacterium]
MTSTGHMTYGSTAHHPISPPRRPWRVGLVVLVIGIVLGLTSGWVGENWRTFDSKADTSLCHLLDDRC